MKNSFKKSFMFMMLLLALMVSAVGVTPALADDGVTPPTDAPAVEQPVGDAPVVDAPAAEGSVTEVPVVAEEPAMMEEPVMASEQETAIVAEVLEQLPEDTALVLLDENGEAIPLASQEAAEVVATADPYFYDGTQIVGFSESGLCPSKVAVCTQSDTPIQAAVDAFAQNQNANGYIYIEAGTYNGDVEIDAETYNFDNLYGLMGSENVFINGDMNLYGFSSGFELLEFTLNGSLGAYDFSEQLIIYGVTVNSDQDSAIFISGYSGDVYMDNVEANATCDGCRGVEFGKGNGDVTIVDSDFSSEESAAAKFYRTSGEVLIEGGNFEGPNEHGILFDTHQGNVTLNEVTASGGEFGSAIVVDGDVFINGGNFEGGQGATGFMVEGDVTVENATLHDSSFGIYAMDVTGTLDACNNVFDNNGTDIYVDEEFSGVFDGCSPVNPPVVPPANPPSTVLINQPFVKEFGSKEYGDEPVNNPMYKPFSEGELPGSLPSGVTFVAGVKVTQVDVSITLDIPADMQGKSIRVLFWNGSTWVEVSASISTNGRQITFLADKAGSYVLVTP